MEKIKINLLPVEFTKSLVEQSKFRKIQTISVLFLLALIVLASAIITLRFLQSKDISQNQTQMREAESEVQNLKNKEISLTVLKSRVGTIGKLTANPSKQKSIYSLVNSLTPANIFVNTIVVDKNANVNLSVSAVDSTALADYLVNLTSVEKNEDRISQVIIDSLSRNKDGSFRAGLKIISKLQ